MTEKNDLLERIVLGEIEGKNRAIHAYDGIVWKIRTGFLTLLFGGWAILLKGIVESTERWPGAYQSLAWGLFLFSLGFAFGARYVDRSYVRRKFRVILALDRLTDEIRACGGDYLKISPELLKVAGDSADMPYGSKGYREAVKAELSVYLIPLVILVVVIMLVVR
ncbi:MAG: hypothetical protein Q8P46_02895 [Hyphomicrobiales bacterium]|nr:hypothetical protein [Hyphomicrobiales bacterium]